MPRSPSESPERPPSVCTPVHRCSRRKLGLPPEHGLLLDTAPRRQVSEPEVMAQASLPPQLMLQQPRTPSSFYGTDSEDVDDWLDQFERVASFNKWTPAQKLENVYYSLEDGARIWFENRERRLETWDDFRREVRDSFASSDRRDRAQSLLEIRIQKPNESVVMFVEDMARLFRRADPDMSEPKKLRYLMHGVKEQLFAGLVRNPPRTVQEFIKEATAIERAVQERCRQYARTSIKTPSPSAASLSTTMGDNNLRELVRSVVREELAKCGIGIAPSQPAVISVADVVRQEIRQAISAPEPLRQAISAPEPPRTQLMPQMDYATALRCHMATAPTAATMPPPTYSRPQPPGSWPQREFPARPQIRKTDVWRTEDHQPLCYHCGEPGHVYRRCPYREIGLPGFPPTARRPRFGERPVAISEYLATRQSSEESRPSRSPSPARYASPTRRDYRGSPTRRSPSPRRGN